MLVKTCDDTGQGAEEAEGLVSHISSAGLDGAARWARVFCFIYHGLSVLRMELWFGTTQHV